MTDPLAFLGRGVARPFARAASDLAIAEGVEHVRRCVAQMLGTRGDSARASGELQWDPARGSKLHLLRHQNLTVHQRELALVYCRDAVAAFEPRARVTQVVDVAVADQRSLVIRILFDVVDTDGTTLATGLEEAVEVEAA